MNRKRDHQDSKKRKEAYANEAGVLSQKIESDKVETTLASSTLPMKANIDKRFLWRLGLIASVLLAMALWFLYDGAIAYPRQRERALQYQELEEQDRLNEWKEIARERGWPTENPGKPKDEVDSHVQFVMALLVALPGLLFSFLFFRARGRWIEADATGLRTSWGQQVEFGQIVALDEKKWKSKGIAKVHYRRDGRKCRLILDEWKYHVEPIRAILREIESGLDASQIVGGAPERDVLTQNPDADSGPASGE